MSKMKYKKIKKTLRREARSFMHRLLTEMSFIERLKFLFKGEYHSVMKRVVKNPDNEYIK